jgi:hypothetical protein
MLDPQGVNHAETEIQKERVGFPSGKHWQVFWVMKERKERKPHCSLGWKRHHDSQN